MEKDFVCYNDELMPDSFEEMAKAYSIALKKKGFIFIRLEEEELNLLINEILVLLSKMKACLIRLQDSLDGNKLFCQLEKCEENIVGKFPNKKTQNFHYLENENSAFLSLISIENMLIIKLMSLSSKSGEYELCNNLIVEISSIFAESFSLEGFVCN